MNLPTFPASVSEIDPRSWDSFRPFYEELAARPLTEETLRDWLHDWSRLTALLEESTAVIYVEKSLDTADKEKEQIFLDHINEVIPAAKVAEQTLKERFLAFLPVASDVIDDLALVVRDMRNEAALFRAENIPLQTELAQLDNEFDKITGGLATDWEGEQKNLSQLATLLEEKDRAVRKKAWTTMMSLYASQRQRLNEIYGEMLTLRQQVATNAGFETYRDYAFRKYGRFDYTPADCFTFHKAIETVVVPAARRVNAKRQAALGVSTLRPWDMVVDPSDAPPLAPYKGQDALIQTSLNIFRKVDVELGRYFSTMAAENLLDLETRTGKALGGYCTTYELRKRPFIFMNGTGLHGDVQTMLHEAGHAFHVFEGASLPFIWQTDPPMEFCEVASMAMELLAAPYLTRSEGGFYTKSEAARARIKHLEEILTFLPYMAVVDAFQHWVYTHVEAAKDAANCDATWRALWARFMPDGDWSGHEEALATGWHRKLHIFSVPLYYIEYGMAQIGALQVWRNSLTNRDEALAAYRHALSLGSTKSLPELFAAAGAEFRFDVPLLTELVTLIEDTVAELEAVAAT